MRKFNRKEKFRIILVLMGMCSVLFYMTPLRDILPQELFTRFFYIPIILGGLWFGLWGGIEVSLAVTLICAPHSFFIAYVKHEGLFYDELLELFLFNLVGALVGALRDRERRQTAMNQRLQALAAIGETVSTVAHEIKNMLMPMRGFLRRIREQDLPGGKVTTYLDIVEGESAKLEKMVKDMLAFGRYAPLQREDMQVKALLADARQILDEEFRHNGVSLICQCKGGERHVSLDREKIRHALVNLLQNALQVSRKGDNVRLLVRCYEDRLQITVEDEGPGIPKEHLERIFQPFFTTKPQGTGLGLAITQRIVQEHGGDIRVESTPETGTRFILSFPSSVQGPDQNENTFQK